MNSFKYSSESYIHGFKAICIVSVSDESSL